MDAALRQKIIQWKEQYGSLYAITVEDVEIIYRSMTITEYRRTADEDYSTDVEDWVLSQAVLHPDSIVERLTEPGRTQLYQDIFKNSMFGDQDQIEIKTLEFRRKYADDLWRAVCLMIIKAMPAYKLAELEAMTDEQLLQLYICSEVMTGTEILAPTKLQDARKQGKIPTPPVPRQVNTPPDMQPNLAMDNPGVDPLQQASMDASVNQLTNTMRTADKTQRAKSFDWQRDNQEIKRLNRDLNR